WGGNKSLLAVNSGETVIILNEQVMNAHYNHEFKFHTSQLAIENFTTDYHQDLKTDIHIKGVFVTKSHTAIWNGKKVVIYEVASDKSMVRGRREQSSRFLQFSEAEGDPVLLDICGNFLVAGTSMGYIKEFLDSDICFGCIGKLNNTVIPKSLEESIAGIGKLKSVKCNCNGTKVSVMCDKVNNTPDTRIYVWDIELDAFQSFDFSTGHGTGADDGDKENPDIMNRAQQAGRNRWQETLVTVLGSHRTQSDVMVISLFSTPENGILLQDFFPVDSAYFSLLGVQVPYFYLVKKEHMEMQNRAGLEPLREVHRENLNLARQSGLFSAVQLGLIGVTANGWAQYMESHKRNGNSSAVFTKQLVITCHLVRVYCYCGNLEKAAEICNENGARAASLPSGNTFENQ
ncbi:hypothetical protein OS493_039919, partial [Desmophyllum pertusum]